MGNTIRREPVTFDIPKSPDYRHLNITNFRGLDVSSNPFELDNNTASDCLNVYVDESNTLTTRPRLQKKYVDLLKTLGDTWQPIGYYKLHDGYLLHGKLNGQPVMKLYINDGPLKDITGTIPTNKCKIFEQGENVYLLDRENYTVINRTEKVIKDVEGYVPTTATVDIDGNRFDVEPLNLLSDKYKESYYWDGTWNPRTAITNIIDINNMAIQSTTITTAKFKPVKKLSTLSTNSYSYWYGIDEYGFPTKITIDNLNGNVIKSERDSDLPVNMNDNKLLACTATPDGKRFLIVEDKTNKNIKILVSSESGDWFISSIDKFQNDKYTVNINTLDIASNGNFVLWNMGDKLALSNYKGHTPIEITLPDESFEIISFKLSANNKIIVIDAKHPDTLQSRLYVTHLTEGLNNTYSAETELIAESSYLFLDYTVSPNGAFIIYLTENAKVSDRIAVDINKYTIEDKNIIAIENAYSGLFTHVITTNTLCYLLSSSQFAILNMNKNELVWHEQTQHSYASALYNQYMYADDVALETPFIEIDTYLGSTYNTIDKIQIDYKNPIIITRELSENIDYHNLLDNRKILFKSYLNTRFDNNYWFANGNRYYRSRNNDPTYFPITEYNDLGDSNLPITGFNLANDTTLIAYKDDRLYLIQPFESSSGTREYSITESKNTVGNTAIDAPIVTTLTEIPLQMNNDGVYGLSQLSNVSATERIADLMSRPINQRWLDIPDDIIKNAQTLNRLYWTYIILPDDEKNKTSIYLLDNRTNSWYYWELPIVVLDSFVVNNRTEFADKNGEIYYLTTTDIDVPNFDDVLVTEYYDDGEKLIDWYWQSQIMYLGTINYTKRLVNTTFILTDDDTTDGYGLKYGFKVFRKLASSVPDKEISNDINLVRSTTRKTNISKFGFLQMKISNITPDDRGTEERKEFRNNKLRLVGLGLKYVLLEGLIR